MGWGLCRGGGLCRGREGALVELLDSRLGLRPLLPGAQPGRS